MMPEILAITEIQETLEIIEILTRKAEITWITEIFKTIDKIITIMQKIAVKFNKTLKHLNIIKINKKKNIKEAKKAEVERHKEEGGQEDNELNI